jgi:glycosyltransferase involved in cell wall biosynthesis
MSDKSLSLPATAILIPAFNEGDVIADVIQEIRTTCDLPIFVIDDASTDDTISKAQAAGANIIPLPAQLGAWGAMQTGLRYAMRQKFEVVITMDADGQHEPSSVANLVQPVSQGIADVSIGTCTSRGSLLRKIAWVMMKKCSGLTLEDITSGYRVYNRKAIRELASWQATLLDYQDIGVLLLLQSKGMRIVDVETPMQPRRNGKSHIFSSWLTVMYYMIQTLTLGLSKRQLVRRYYNPRASR